MEPEDAKSTEKSSLKCFSNINIEWPALVKETLSLAHSVVNH